MNPQDKNSNEAGTRPTDPLTGEAGEVRDLREHFAALTSQAPRLVEAERAFILAKIETVKKPPHLSEDEKKAAIEELKALLP